MFLLLNHLAGKFTTDGSAYTVTGASAMLRNVVGAGVATYEASIWTDSPGLPSTKLGVFSNNPTIADGDNTATLAFTTAGIGLSANTNYWLAMRNTTGTYLDWVGTDSDAESSPGTWTIDNSAVAEYITPSPGTWAIMGSTGGIVPRFSIDAEAVPEASTYALFGLGAVGMMFLRRRKAR